MFNVKLPKFEGPLYLLLQLIEEQKLDISELSIAKVADDYLEFIRNTDDISLENLSEFVSIAAKIILIKSRNILPSLEVTPEEEKEIKDLEEQLRIYKKFREASGLIGKMLAKKRIMFTRDYLAQIANVFSPPENCNASEFKKTYMKLIEQIVLPEKLRVESVGEIVTLEQKIEELKTSLQKRVETSFSQLRNTSKNKIEVIVSFLAMLELVKRRIIQVEQLNLFDEIKIKNASE